MNKEPLAYRKGKIKFLNCIIDVQKKVFIPRKETEFWVKKIIAKIKKQKIKKPLKILDIFAGSGCIGIAILKNIKNSKVDFVDIDKKCIEQIKINLKLNKIDQKRTKLYCSNVFEKLDGKFYDFIFANPPYVAKERIHEVQESVLKFEPKRAILGGEKGLFYIKKLLKKVKNHLKDGGELFMECDPYQKNEIKSLLFKLGLKNFSFMKDQFGKIRLLRVKK
jgi:release factor glutamine methyltransferase